MTNVQNYFSFVQIVCDLCGKTVPLKKILVETELNYLCEPCWEDMLARAGDE